jgi:hypothetical protein
VAESISRRKYAKLVKFFTSLVEDPKTSQRVRLTAACRLDDILARSEARADRIADRKARLTARAETPVEVEPAEPEELVDPEEERAREQLNRIFGDRNAAE